MSASSKKSIPLSAYDRSRLVTEHAMRAQAVEMVLNASHHISTSNPELTNISDRQTVPDNKGKLLVSRAEGFKINKICKTKKIILI